MSVYKITGPEPDDPDDFIAADWFEVGANGLVVVWHDSKAVAILSPGSFSRIVRDDGPGEPDGQKTDVS